MKVMRFLCTVGLLLVTSSAAAIELEGYTEPLRSINVAADETGTIEEVFVQEGEQVVAGQPLAKLHSEVHRALLAIAAQNMQAEGRLDAASADLEMKRQRLQKLRSLRTEGHARQEEVDRAFSEVAVAEANVRAVQDDLAARSLEFEKIQTQIRRRTIFAPVDGVVTALLKEKGEFIAPNTPELLTLVQVDSLLANFTLLGEQAANVKLEQEINVEFVDSGKRATGTVTFVSPVTDAESGTVLIRIRIADPERQYRSGARCRIQLRD